MILIWTQTSLEQWDRKVKLILPSLAHSLRSFNYPFWESLAHFSKVTHISRIDELLILLLFELIPTCGHLYPSLQLWGDEKVQETISICPYSPVLD